MTTNDPKELKNEEAEVELTELETEEVAGGVAALDNGVCGIGCVDAI